METATWIYVVALLAVFAMPNSRIAAAATPALLAIGVVLMYLVAINVGNPTP